MSYQEISIARQDTLEARGGIKYNATTSKPQIYDTANEAWVDFEAGGGGGNPILTIKNEGSEFTGITFTVTLDMGGFSTSATMTGETLSIEVPYLGDYTLSYPNAAGAIMRLGVTVVGMGNTLIIPTSPVIHPFATATWDEIVAMANGWYEGTVSNLQTYWSLGDTKTIELSSMDAEGVGEKHSAQTAELTIIDFAHDTLTTPINGQTKAAVTLQLKDSLNETGYMNSTNTNQTGWTSSARRSWCNSTFINSLPVALQRGIKFVNKLTSAGNQSATIKTDSDKAFLPSEVEIYNSNTYAKAGEGTQYTYYQTTANRIKKVNGSANNWWLRSPYGSNSTGFVRVNSGGSVDYSYASNAIGLAPALCI